MSNAIQLYSVREMLKQDYMGTLKYLADIGYDGVEFFGGVEANCGYSTKEIKEKLEFLGLEAVSAHVGFDVLEKNFDFITDYYKEIGVKCIVCPWVYAEQIETVEKAGYGAMPAGEKESKKETTEKTASSFKRLVFSGATGITFIKKSLSKGKIEFMSIIDTPELKSVRVRSSFMR